MIFAKALCVVLLLYSASFGDSRSLKNDTDSEKRTVYLSPAPQVEQNANHLVLRTKKMIIENAENVKPHAEAYRGFLLFLLREIWRPAGFCKGPFSLDQNDIGSINVQDFTLKGLYFFFFAPPVNVQNMDVYNTEKQSEIYPLYVGITGRSFRERFKEHRRTQNGVLKKLGDAGVSWIVAYVVDMPLPVAKFYESLFLSLFDFAMNKEENGNERTPKEVFTNTVVKKAKEGYVYFEQEYDYVMKKYFNELAKHTSINDAEQFMQNYDFN